MASKKEFGSLPSSWIIWNILRRTGVSSYSFSFEIILSLFKYSCLHLYSTISPTPASHLQTYPLWPCPRVLYTCSLVVLSLLSLSPLHSGNCQFVLYFNVSGFILLACLFVDWVPLIGDFIAAQFTIAKCWKQPKCPSVNEWIKKLWYIYTLELYAAERKKSSYPLWQHGWN